MFNSNAKLTELKGVGEKTAQVFSSHGIGTIGELLHYYPRDYDWFDVPVHVSELKAGQVAALRLFIVGNGSTVQAGSYKVTTFRAADATGQIRLTYFNMPYLQKTLQRGSVHVFRGRVSQHQNGGFLLTQPAVYSVGDYEKLQNGFWPLYPLFQGVKNPQLIRIMQKALDGYSFGSDYLPEADRQSLGLCSEEAALRGIHFPKDSTQLLSARNRLVFDEFLSFILTIKRDRAVNDETANPSPMLPVAQTQRLIEALPYALTDDQKKAWQDIENDLCGPHIMNRLLQGDVGSGKTILAFLALLLCACNGRQGALMAPTEVLAVQHMEKIKAMSKRFDLPIHPILLTGSVKGKARKEAYAQIASGEANVIIGTHALIQDAVVYHQLGLVITDEQHRFGVRQREALAAKAGTGDQAATNAPVPVLVMSATPIPRTLAIILYGDLSVSQLRQLPGNRLPIRNLAIGQEARPRVYRFIYRQIQAGRQAYVICPAIGGEKKETEPSDACLFSQIRRQEFSGQEENQALPLPDDIPGRKMTGAVMSSDGQTTDAPGAGVADISEEQTENVLSYTKKLRSIFPPQVRIEMLHGKMKPAQKNQIMTAFANHDIDILVSTTVIEVGIDVPNASTILIENAEHFGLSQLHQLRGRVGRGAWQSYCIFMYSAGIREKPKRLQILEKSNDGFHIAEEDLKLRGPGDIFGTRQSGEFGFRLADIYEDAGILQKAASYADEILQQHKTISIPTTLEVNFRSI